MQLEKCAALHPYAMILREKDMNRQDYMELARRIQIMCKEASVKMFVHSDISAAKYAGCGNVHFSMEHFKQMCEEQADVIKRLDCVSVSCHSMEEAVNAVRAGADQIVLGTIFETQLLSNAVKYTLKGTVTITVSEEKKLTVTDTGMGIAPEDLPRIFEKGYTGYNGRMERKSTGIGLYLSQMAAKKLGHQITVESKLGEGSSFTIGLAEYPLRSE